MVHPWVAHYDPGVSPVPHYPDLTLTGLLDRTASRHGDRIATIFHGARVRYRELQAKVNAFAAGLERAGIRPGDRVAVMLPNLPQFIVAFYGTLRAAAIAVPTNPLYTRRELEHQLVDSGARALVTLDQFFPRVQEVLPSTSIRCVIVTDPSAALPPHLRLPFRLQERRRGVRTVPRGGVVHRFDDLLAAPALTPSPPATPDDLAVLQYTGGTTGLPKGAMLTHRNLAANAIQAHDWQGALQGDEATILCAIPFFHVYGLTVGMNLAIVAGGTMLLAPRFVPREVASLIERHRPQLFPGVPTMYVALSNLPDFRQRRFGSLRYCISGAAPLPPEVQRRFMEGSGVRVVEGYGLTEASPVTHCNPVAGAGRIGTIGVPFPDTDAMVVEQDSWEPVPPGTLGELVVSGPQVMQGYWNRPEETAQVLHNGWLRTGDLAVMEEDGYFRIVDRKKDMIDASGFNVYPREVEDVLYRHPKVQEAAVVGIPHPYRGETVKAVIVLKAGQTATAAEIERFCRQELTAYKVPRIIEFTDTLPKTLVGKVLRRELRRQDQLAETYTET